jgi:hypothetical protein
VAIQPEGSAARLAVKRKIAAIAAMLPTLWDEKATRFFGCGNVEVIRSERGGTFMGSSCIGVDGEV